jgi:hypothetical protein
MICKIVASCVNYYARSERINLSPRQRSTLKLHKPGESRYLEAEEGLDTSRGKGKKRKLALVIRDLKYRCRKKAGLEKT